MNTHQHQQQLGLQIINASKTKTVKRFLLVLGNGKIILDSDHSHKFDRKVFLSEGLPYRSQKIMNIRPQLSV